MKYRLTLSLLPFLVFLPLQQLGFLSVWSLGEAVRRKEVFGVVGSSVLLDPEYGANVSNIDVLWTFNGSNGSPVNILDYAPAHEGHQKEEPIEHFRSRLQFSTSNGSLKLNNLKPTDRGTYTITVGTDWQWSADLELIEPLSRPLIFSNCAYVDTSIELTCLVSSGTASSILWWKDGKVITNGQRHQIVQNNSTLIISKAKKSDGGDYTCTVENPVSMNKSSYSHVIYGLSQQHYYTLGLSIAALTILAASSLRIRMNSFLPAMKSPQLFENILTIFQFFPMLSSVLLMAAIVSWIQVEGADEVTWFMLVLLVLLLLPHALLMFTKCFPIKLQRILATETCCVILSALTLFGDTVVTIVSAILIQETLKRAEKGFEPAAKLPPNLILAAAPFILILPLLLYYFTCGKMDKGTTGSADHFELEEQNRKSPNSLNIVSSEEKLKFLTTHSSEEKLEPRCTDTLDKLSYMQELDSQ
ncbi:uncharacterized protein LOC144496849 [Mustelus asterias]